MADGRWVMTETELNNVACGFERRDTDGLPNFRQHRQVDNRDGKAEKVCAFCGCEKLEAGFGGYGDGFGYHSFLCPECGGSTDLVYKDEIGKYFDKEKEMGTDKVKCLIEHHAMLFALMSRQAITTCGEAGKEAILEGMTRYGQERGARMAANALSNGDELTTMTNQAYGEWVPDYPGQMDFGQIQTEPTLQTYIAKCAWCDAWKKHDITEFGKYYCVNVDNAVYQGYRSDFVCTPITTAMSWGGERCEFDWGHPLTAEEKEALPAKKAELGSRFHKDFNFHTAHIKYTISKTLVEKLGDAGQKAVDAALAEYVEMFGQEYLDVLSDYDPSEF